jgi:hypothetical protein
MMRAISGAMYSAIPTRSSIGLMMVELREIARRPDDRRVPGRPGSPRRSQPGALRGCSQLTDIEF